MHEMSSIMVFISVLKPKKGYTLRTLSYFKFILSRLTLDPSTPSSSQFSSSSRSQTPPSPSLQLSSSTESRTPPSRRSAPPRTPDSTDLTPSSRRASARRRTRSSPSSPTPVLRLARPQRIIRPRHFYGDTPTPPPTLQPQTKKCSRQRHIKPLGDYIDRITGEEYSVCEACRNEVQNFQVRLEEIEDDIRRGEEELERAMDSHGIFNLAPHYSDNSESTCP